MCSSHNPTHSRLPPTSVHHSSVKPFLKHALRPDGNGLVKEVRRHPRADFEAAHVGRWLDEHPAPSAARTVPPALRGRVGGGAGS